MFLQGKDLLRFVWNHNIYKSLTILYEGNDNVEYTWKMKMNYERKTTKCNKQTAQSQIHAYTQNKNIMTKDKQQKNDFRKSGTKLSFSTY